MSPRYGRQVLFNKIGEEGQQRLGRSRVLLVGCGALGTVIADGLVRAGVGHVRICDRDFIELNNLQRQVLFDEDDIAAGLPKAEAAARKLRRINSEVTVEADVVDVNAANIERLADGADLILDGADNFETRFLVNDLAIKTGRPWIYGAVVAASGLVMPVIPGQTPCLRCVFDTAPPPEMSPTCDTAGVIGPAVGLVASFELIEAMKILTGRLDEVTRRLISIDAWSGRVAALNVADESAANGASAGRDATSGGGCACCGRRVFDYLDGSAGSTATTLCGRDAVQVRPAAGAIADFPSIAAKLTPVATGSVKHNEYMLTAAVDGLTITVFRDGRAIIKGTKTPDIARSAYAKYVGC